MRGCCCQVHSRQSRFVSGERSYTVGTSRMRVHLAAGGGFRHAFRLSTGFWRGWRDASICACMLHGGEMDQCSTCLSAMRADIA